MVFMNGRVKKETSSHTISPHLLLSLLRLQGFGKPGLIKKLVKNLFINPARLLPQQQVKAFVKFTTECQ